MTQPHRRPDQGAARKAQALPGRARPVFGFKDRQTVSAIETGERRLSAEELLLAVEKLGRRSTISPIPSCSSARGSSPGANRMSRWRGSPTMSGPGRWIAALPDARARRSASPRRCCAEPRAHNEEQLRRGHGGRRAIRRRVRAGRVPADAPCRVMERELGILVLMVDAIEGVSGAACRLPDLDVVLINRHEVAGRRHFDLAHELFHILTWDTMPPEHVEEAPRDSGNSRRAARQQLRVGGADAGARRSIASATGRASTQAGRARLNAAADALQVTATALQWRLVALGRLDRAARTTRFRTRRCATTVAQAGRKRALPPLFSKPFVEVIALAIERGPRLGAARRRSARPVDRRSRRPLRDARRRSAVRAVRRHGASSRSGAGRHQRHHRMLAGRRWRALAGGYRASRRWRLRDRDPDRVPAPPAASSRSTLRVLRASLDGGPRGQRRRARRRRWCATPDSLLDAGERTLWAHALTRSDAWVLCGPDKASLRFGVRLGFRDRLVSLEALAGGRGPSPQGALKDAYTTAWLAKTLGELAMPEGRDAMTTSRRSSMSAHRSSSIPPRPDRPATRTGGCRSRARAPERERRRAGISPASSLRPMTAGPDGSRRRGRSAAQEEMELDVEEPRQRDGAGGAAGDDEPPEAPISRAALPAVLDRPHCAAAAETSRRSRRASPGATTDRAAAAAEVLFDRRAPKTAADEAERPQGARGHWVRMPARAHACRFRR